MDMKVDSKLIRAEREKRAWSQEHLAEVTGLGLRTVQRIENTGAASYESVRALAAVLELEASSLRLPDAPPPRFAALRRWARPSRPVHGAGAAVVAAAVGLFVAGTGVAEQIMLDVGISMNDTKNEVRAWKTRALVDEGTLVQDVNDLTVFEKLKLQIVPTITDQGHILIAAKVFVYDGTDHVLVSSPRLVTEDGKAAGIKYTADDGTKLELEITAARFAAL